MNTPRGVKRADFNEKINPVISAIETSYENNRLSEDRLRIQKHLDVLAEKYQSDEELGQSRHKLYDAQALLFYLLGHDDRALEFVEAAEEVNYGPTSISEQIRDGMRPAQHANHEVQPHTQAHHKKLPIAGWLAVLVLSLGLGICYNIYGFISDFSTKNSLTSDVISQYPGVTTLLSAEIAAYGAAIVTALVMIYLIFQRRKTAKYLGIIFYISVFIFCAIDITAAQQIFANNPDALNAVNQAESSSSFAIVVSVIWAFYLFFSKRVKETLTT